MFFSCGECLPERYSYNDGVDKYALSPIDERCIKIGLMIYEDNLSISRVAKEMDISPSTVFNDVHNRLKYISDDLYMCVITKLRKRRK